MCTWFVIGRKSVHVVQGRARKDMRQLLCESQDEHSSRGVGCIGKRCRIAEILAEARVFVVFSFGKQLEELVALEEEPASPTCSHSNAGAAGGSYDVTLKS